MPPRVRNPSARGPFAAYIDATRRARSRLAAPYEPPSAVQLWGPVPTSPSIRRIVAALANLAVFWCFGALLLRYVGQGRWSLGDSFYQVGITIFTVGFAELPGTERVPFARAFITLLMVIGVATVSYVQAAVTAMLIEGSLGEAYRKNRMKKLIDSLEGHLVIAGAGSAGRYVVEELASAGRPFVVIDRDEARLKELSDEVCEGSMLYVVGDATHDHVLQAAGVERASGVVAALTADTDNLYVTLSARSMNATARIVSKAVSAEAERKMHRAGASSVVSPNTIGGRRMANELLRPEVVEFLDQMHRADDALRIEELTLPANSPLVGRSLRQARMRPRTNALVVAMRTPDGALLYSPGPDVVLHASAKLIVLGAHRDLENLRALLASG